MTSLGKTLILLCLFLLLSSYLTAESPTGILTGKIESSSTKEVLVGVNVVLVGTSIGTVTDIEGNFIIKNIPVGTYQVRFSQIGYGAIIKSDIVIAAGKPRDLHFELSETLLDLNEVTITADYFQKNFEKPISMQTQGAEEIRRLPGGLEDVVRAVSILPGVAQVSAGRNDLIVRGGAPSENLFLIDNVEVSNINHFGTQGATGGPTSFINLDYVSSTEFSSGGFGARYGDKLSSILTVNLKDGRTDRIGGKATVSATQFGLSTEGPIDGNGSFIFSARRSYLDFIFKAAGFSFVPEYWDFLIKGNYKISSRDELTLISISAIDDVKQFNDTREKVFNNSQILASAQYEAIAGLSWRHLFNGGFSTVTLGTTYFKYDSEQRDTSLLPIFTNQSFEREISVRGDVVYMLRKNTELGFGLSGKVIPFESNLFLRPYTTSFGETVTASAQYRATALKSGAYVQLTQMWERFRFTVGGRLDYFDMLIENMTAAPRLSATYRKVPSVPFQYLARFECSQPAVKIYFCGSIRTRYRSPA
jgi:hypothetical protein